MGGPSDHVLQPGRPGIQPEVFWLFQEHPWIACAADMINKRGPKNSSSKPVDDGDIRACLGKGIAVSFADAAIATCDNGGS